MKFEAKHSNACPSPFPRTPSRERSAFFSRNKFEIEHIPRWTRMNIKGAKTLKPSQIRHLLRVTEAHPDAQGRAL